MEARIPKRLKKEPLVEVIWHVIYEPASGDKPSGDLLVGILYTALQGQGKNYQVRRLPLADIPREIAELDPNLHYTVKYRLESPEDPILYQIGDRIVSVNCRRPYVGWSEFRKSVLFFKDVLEKSQLMIPKRYGIRYIDLIKREDMEDISGLQLELKVGGQKIKDQPLQLRVRLNFLNKEHTVQIVSPAKVKFAEGEEWEGTLIDLETGVPSPNGWNDISEEAIEELHEASKAMFFLEILKPETIEKLEPEY